MMEIKMVEKMVVAKAVHWVGMLVILTASNLVALSVPWLVGQQVVKMVASSAFLLADLTVAWKVLCSVV